MSLKMKLITLAIAFVLGLSLGRYSNRQPASTSAKADIKTTDNTNRITDKKTVVVQEPTGKTVTTITEETRVDTSKTADVKTQETTKAAPQWQVSALGGLDIHTMAPVYGAAASKQLLGPITVGAFGLTNGTVGVSIGFTF